MRYSDFKIILEYNRSKTVQRLGDKIAVKAKTDPALRGKPLESIVDIVMQKFEEADPTKNKQFVQWMATQYVKGQLKYEDIYKLKDDLIKFVDPKFRSELKRKNINADINHYTPETLVKLISQLSSTEIASDDDSSNVEGARVLYDGPLGKLVIPETEQASCQLGSGTRWCTAADKDNMFNNYSNMGPLYIWIERKNKKIGKKFQFHFESGQFMDAQDHPITGTLLDYFVKENPITSKLFKQKNPEMFELVKDWANYQDRETGDHGERYHDDNLDNLEVENFIPLLTDEQLVLLLKKYNYNSELKKIIYRIVDNNRPELSRELSLKSPSTAYDYAKRNPNKVTDEIEDMIAQEARTAYFYALYKLKAPFPKGEQTIAKDPSYAFFYAEKVLNGRFPAGEPAMKTSERIWDQYKKYIAKDTSL